MLRSRSRYQPLPKGLFEPLRCCILSLGADMRRREFLGVLGGAAATWPLAGRAQQPDRMRRIGVLIGTAERDSEGQARLAALRQGLEKLDWTEGRNIQIEVRWSGS